MTPNQSTLPEIEEIRARAEKATVGPWAVELHTARVLVGDDKCYIADVFDGRRADDCDCEISSLNADFIAHARTDIPKLLSIIDSLEAEKALSDEAWEDVRHERENAIRLIASARSDALEEAAKVAETFKTSHGCCYVPGRIARLIRAIGPTPPPQRAG